jgi:hypothetical protein
MTKKKKSELALLLEDRSLLKQDVSKRTCEAYDALKVVIEKKLEDLRSEISNERVRLKYDQNGDYETHAYVGSNVMVFHMHTNVFSFPKEHGIWKNSYVEKDSDRAYCGVINIYNFLADSFLHNRMNDAGYLIGRVFVNKEGHYMMEGKGELGFLFKDFKGSTFDDRAMQRILDSAMKHVVEFDLQAPQYEKVQFVDVKQIKALSSIQELRTGKRLGFKFKSELE